MPNDTWSFPGGSSSENNASENNASSRPTTPSSGSNEPSSPETPVSHNPTWSSSWNDPGQQAAAQSSDGSNEQPRVIRHVPSSPDFESDTTTQIANKPWGQASATPAPQGGSSAMGGPASTGQQPGQYAGGQYGGGQSSGYPGSQGPAQGSWGAWNQPSSQASASQPASQPSASQPRGWENSGWTPNPSAQNPSAQNAGAQHQAQGWEQTTSLPQQGGYGAPSWQQQAPQKKAPRTGGIAGFLRNLFDFSFTRYVSPSIVKVLYILSIIGVGLYWLLSIVYLFVLGASKHVTMNADGTIGSSGNHGATALAVADLLLGWIPALLAIALIRMQYEYMVALVRTSEYARDIKAKLGAPTAD